MSALTYDKSNASCDGANFYEPHAALGCDGYLITKDGERVCYYCAVRKGLICETCEKLEHECDGHEAVERVEAA